LRVACGRGCKLSATGSIEWSSAEGTSQISEKIPEEVMWTEWGGGVVFIFFGYFE